MFEFIHNKTSVNVYMFMAVLVLSQFCRLTNSQTNPRYPADISAFLMCEKSVIRLYDHSYDLFEYLVPFS